MKAVAVTGSFGAGKSSVLKFARSMRIPALDADKVVAGLYRESLVKARLLAAFGTAGKEEIAGIAFSSPKKRKKLESILHPMVWRSVEEWLEEMRVMGKRLAFVEVPLLFEAGWEKRFDCAVVVKAPRKKCLARLAAKGVSKREALPRLKAQLPLKKKVKKAQFIIDNGNAPAETRAQVKSIVEKLAVFC